MLKYCVPVHIINKDITNIEDERLLQIISHHMAGVVSKVIDEFNRRLMNDPEEEECKKLISHIDQAFANVSQHDVS